LIHRQLPSHDIQLSVINFGDPCGDHDGSKRNNRREAFLASSPPVVINHDAASTPEPTRLQYLWFVGFFFFGCLCVLCAFASVLVSVERIWLFPVGVCLFLLGLFMMSHAFGLITASGV